MKSKKIIVAIAMLFAVLISGCSEHQNSSVKDNYISEWVSPDGVHYWVIESCTYYAYYVKGVAPRYDRNGNLVID